MAASTAIEPTIIGQNTSEIGMPNEEDTIHIPHLPLEPVRTSVDGGGRWHRRDFVGVCLHPNACIMSDAKEVVDDLESLRSRWIVGGSNVHRRFKQTVGVVFEIVEHRDNARGGNHQRYFVLVDAEFLDKLGE